MEKREIIIPQADKLIGIPREWDHYRDSADQLFEDFYKTEGVEMIEGIELIKGEREIELIDFVNHAVQKYLKQYGREMKKDMPLEKIHILRDGGTKEYTDNKFSGGAHSAKYGSILVDRVSSDMQFSIILFHEQMHNNSYKALQFTKSPKRNLEPYRSGISVTSRDGQITYLEDIEEAIIQTFTEKFYQDDILHSDLFKDEREHQTENVTFIRTEEQTKISNLIDNIWLKNENYFESRKDVEDIFFNAQINGRLLPLVRLIERTYGKGSFRELAQQTKVKSE